MKRNLQNDKLVMIIIARSAYYVPLAHQEPASVRARPRPRPRRRPASGQISKCPKNGPPETDFRGDRTGRGVPILVHFWDLTQIRQLTQSDPIILILCVHKKPKNGLLNASRPPPCGCCLVLRRHFLGSDKITFWTHKM